jgi:hypothetical protein
VCFVQSDLFMDTTLLQMTKKVVGVFVRFHALNLNSHFIDLRQSSVL